MIVPLIPSAGVIVGGEEEGGGKGEVGGEEGGKTERDVEREKQRKVYVHKERE